MYTTLNNYIADMEIGTRHRDSAFTCIHVHVTVFVHACRPYLGKSTCSWALLDHVVNILCALFPTYMCDSVNALQKLRNLKK